MAEENEHFEERTVTLKKTKKRITEEEANELRQKHKTQEEQTETEPGIYCGNWFIEFVPGYGWATCRICYTGAPTLWPYKECILMS